MIFANIRKVFTVWSACLLSDRSRLPRSEYCCIINDVEYSRPALYLVYRHRRYGSRKTNIPFESQIQSPQCTTTSVNAGDHLDISSFTRCQNYNNLPAVKLQVEVTQLIDFLNSWLPTRQSSVRYSCLTDISRFYHSSLSPSYQSQQRQCVAASSSSPQHLPYPEIAPFQQSHLRSVHDIRTHHAHPHHQYILIRAQISDNRQRSHHAAVEQETSQNCYRDNSHINISTLLDNQ